MKNLLLLLCFFFPTFLFSQSNSKVELIGSLDFSHRIHTNTGWIQSLRSSDKGKLNTHFGVNYFQKLKPKMWLKIGVGFASLGYKTKKSNLIFPSDLTGLGIVDPLLQGIGNSTSQFIYNYHFLEVPFSLQYYFSEKKLKSFVEFGFVPMYYLQSITKHKLNGEKRSRENRQESTFNDIQLASKIAFGFTYAFNEKWEMVVQPNFRYHLTKIADAPVKEHLWSAGLALGIRMSLK